jgi:FkbM family methyltransferase
MIKNVIQKVFKRFGYQLSRTVNSQRYPFVVQSELVKVREPIIFDIGAYIGGVTNIYREQFPLASIYCFEPFPSSFQKLSKNVELDSRIFCYNTAVSSNKGSALLNLNHNSATNSLLKTDIRGASIWGEGILDTISQIEVSTTTVDIFCREAGVSSVDILKMDVQGNEFSVLLGAKGMLATQRISLIYTELIMGPTYEGQHKLHEYLSFFDSFGYELLDFFNSVRSHKQLIQADLIFLSSSFKKGIENRLNSI